MLEQRLNLVRLILAFGLADLGFVFLSWSFGFALDFDFACGWLAFGFCFDFAFANY